MQRSLKVRIEQNGDLTNLAPQDNNSRTQIPSLEPAGNVNYLDQEQKGGHKIGKLSWMGLTFQFSKETCVNILQYGNNVLIAYWEN